MFHNTYYVFVYLKNFFRFLLVIPELNNTLKDRKKHHFDK